MHNSKVNIPGANFFAVYVGTSMNPTLLEPEIIEVMPYGNKSFCVGDVVFFQPPDSKQAVVHRIIRMIHGGISTIGDNNTRIDPYLLEPKHIKGQVISALRGQKRRKIAGALKGRMTRLFVRCRRILDRGVSPLLHPVYRTISQIGLISWVLPASFRPRVVAFHSRGKDQFQILLGQRVIGRFDNQKNQWLIQRPYKLFLDDKILF